MDWSNRGASLAILTLLIALALATVPVALAGCFEEHLRRALHEVVHPTELAEARELLSKNKLQEAAYLFDEAGEHATAQDLRRQLEQFFSRTDHVVTRVGVLDGKSSPEIVRFENGVMGVFKPFSLRNGVASGASEIAAYRMDQILGGKAHVPVTTRMTWKGVEGTVQYYLADAKTAELQSRKSNPFLKFFDYLIDNTDRYSRNIVVWKGREVAVDHGLAFRDMWAIEHLPLETETIWSRLINKACPEALGDECLEYFFHERFPGKKAYEEFRKLPDETIVSALKDVLPAEEVKFLIKRKQQFIEWTDRGMLKHPDAYQ